MKVLGWELKRAQARGVGVEQGNGTSWLTSFLQVFNGPKSSSGIAMNEERALTIAAVYTAVRIIGGTIGSLPISVYRRSDDGGRELAMKHWAYPLLHDSPNEYHTAFTWLEMMVAHLLLWGDSFNRIEWLGNGSAGALYPLMPADVEVRLTSKGVKYYQVRLPDGREDLPDDEVLHIPGLCYDGLRGLSVIGKMRDALGLAKAAENLAGSFFANGAKPGWNLVVPGRMSPEAQKNLAQSMNERFAGKDALGVLVTEEGAKLVGPLTMPFKDAQFVEMRKDSRAEIFGWYGVPPHLGGDTEKSTSWGTGIEQMDIGYAKHTIRPLCVRIEQELNRKLFGRGSRLYAKFNLDALMRGEFKSRMEGLQIAVGRPWLTANEAREIEDWNRSDQEDMDKVALPLNTGAGAPAADTAEPKKDEINALPPIIEMRRTVVREDPNTLAAVSAAQAAAAGAHDAAEKASAAIAKASEAIANAAEARQILDEFRGDVRGSLEDIAASVKQPREIVYDENGEPIGSRVVEKLK